MLVMANTYPRHESGATSIVEHFDRLASTDRRLGSIAIVIFVITVLLNPVNADEVSAFLDLLDELIDDLLEAAVILGR